ncbi:fimbrial protein [Proteus sp. ZN5]|uniref:fimbrial protein n=1 Tax=Proteus sp. ZN5 TaxID=2697019 RepID=UPI0013E1E08B|nr:fimbrial protein [Proteus sp. ZN5]QIG04319.1 fimbrial protein [Proteus sp. ZN5]
MNLLKNISFLSFCIAFLLPFISTSSFAANCKRESGSIFRPYAEFPNGTPIPGVNNGNYPFPVNQVNASFRTAENTTNAANWRMKCTGPVTVMPVLVPIRSLEPRYSSTHPNLQRTLTLGKFYYGAEVTYTSPLGETQYFTGKALSKTEMTPFPLALDATASNPVYLTLDDFNISSAVMYGYQTDEYSRETNWGWGGTMEDIYFYFADGVNPIKKPSDHLFTIFYSLRSVSFLINTCNIYTEDKFKNVNLGRVSNRDFSGPYVGSTTNPVQFDLRLNCQSGVRVSYTIFPSQADNEADPSNQLGLIKLTPGNAAKGYSLQLRSLPFGQSTGNYIPVPFFQPINSPSKTKGDANAVTSSDRIYFDASYYRTLPASQSTGGSANATAIISIDYQ